MHLNKIFIKSCCMLILPLMLIGCATGSKVIYAKYGRLKLQENEVNSYPVNSQDVHFFESCCYTGSDVIFLNRAIHNSSGQYDIYISVSEQLMPQQLQQLHLENTGFQTISSKSELINKIKVDGYLLKHDQHFIARFAYIETKSGLLVIYDVASVQEETVKRIFDEMPAYLNEKIRL